jgi:hypothetical protein
VQAVIDHQARTIAGNQRQADLGTPEGIQAWRDTVIAQAKSSNGKGGCPLGSLAGQLAETDPRARALIAAGFGQWSAAISDGLRKLQATGRLPADIDADDFAITSWPRSRAAFSSPRSSRIPDLLRPRSTPSSPSPPLAEPEPDLRHPGRVLT